jgi:hypothetical protein
MSLCVSIVCWLLTDALWKTYNLCTIYYISAEKIITEEVCAFKVSSICPILVTPRNTKWKIRTTIISIQQDILILRLIGILICQLCMMCTSIANDQKANFHCFAKMMLTELALVIFQHHKIFFGEPKCSQFIGTKETFIFYMCMEISSGCAHYLWHIHVSAVKPKGFWHILVKLEYILLPK